MGVVMGFMNGFSGFIIKAVLVLVAINWLIDYAGQTLQNGAGLLSSMASGAPPVPGTVSAAPTAGAVAPPAPAAVPKIQPRAVP